MFAPSWARDNAMGFQHLLSHQFRSARIEKFQLHNGLTVIVWPDHVAPVFAFQTWFGVGSRHERAGKTGIAHLFEHLMFKATKNHGDGEFDRLLEAQGAQTNAATWVDWTYYREKLPSGNLDLVTRLEADRMENLHLVSEQLEAEREVVINERKLRVDNDPDGQLYEQLYALAFTRHMYGSPTIGWMPDIESLSLEDCLEFYRLYYAPNNATITLVGDVDTEGALALIEERYGHLKSQPVPEEDVRHEPPQTEQRRKELVLPVAADKGVYAWHGPEATHPDHAAVEVLSEVLTGGDSARLYTRLVNDAELATDVSGWVASWKHPGVFEISIQSAPSGSLDAAEAILHEELTSVAEGKLTERELDKAKNGLETYFYRGLADTSSRARGMGHAEIIVGDFRWFFEEAERYRKVTREQVIAVARGLTADRMTAVVARCPGTVGAA